MTQTKQELSALMEIADLHAKRLKYAIVNLQPFVPLSASRFSNLTDAEIPLFELFSSRFSKLQDLMGSKLFGLILDFSKEPGRFDTFLDKLHALEKLGCIDNANQWLLLREIRNHLSHEYPDNPEITANYFNKAFEMVGVLLAYLEKMKVFIQKIEAKQN